MSKISQNGTMQVPLLDIKEQNESLRSEIEAALARVLDTNAFILGSEVAELENETARYCGVTHAIGCASGSDAILLALMALGIGPGDEVITTPYSFFATVSSITRLGATPVFADIEPEYFNIDPARIEAKITSRTKAIEPVHLYGQCADMDAINAIAAKHGIRVIEDAAQALGAKDRERQAGSMGAIGCFSYYPSKNLGGMGDGGMLTTNDDTLAAKLRALRVHGSEERYYHKYVGLNSRLDGFQGAVLRVKLPHLDPWTEKRRANAEAYRHWFTNRGLGEYLTAPIERPGAFHIYNQFVIRVPKKRDELRAFLTENGIGTDIYYPLPLHLQECFAYLGYTKGDLPIAEEAACETLALPIYPELRSEQIEFVCGRIAEFFEGQGV
ncbi:MAG: DegT/DnrJ/EryC1/StrS family aminotransferase [Pyrinomonadaceae bacterium]|nr:DegT/DnrJ/EryC1/StrS family aminotransferase [Pyrinomonadaceae bacterium]